MGSSLATVEDAVRQAGSGLGNAGLWVGGILLIVLALVFLGGRS